MNTPRLKLKRPTQSGTEESPRGSLVNLDELLFVLQALGPDYDLLVEELEEQARYRQHAPNYYKN